MLKQNRKQIIASVLVLILPVLAALCLWNELPDRMPTHWNFAGEVDGWSGKGFAVFGLTGIILAAHMICILATASDPKHQNISGKMLTLVYWICPVVSVLTSAVVYASALNVEIRMDIWPMILIGVLFIVMGNWLPKCRPNYTVGIRLPWTIHSEDNWRKTHRMAGPVWIAGGLITWISAFLGKCGWILFAAVLILMVAAPMVYSFQLYRKSGKD